MNYKKAKQNNFLGEKNKESSFFENLEPRLMLSGNGGDVDLDRDVDWNDLQTLQVNYGRTDADWANGDFNNDNVIDALDYIAMKRNMGSTDIMSAVAEDNELNVYGTDQDDTIDISQVGDDLVFNGDILPGCDSIFVFAYGGSDTVKIDYSVIKDMEIHAGDGNDFIYENGQGISNIYGGNGEDLIVSVGGGADILSGGADRDSVWFDSSDIFTDAEAIETETMSIHSIIEFVAPYGIAEDVPLDIFGQNFTDPIPYNSYGHSYGNNYSSYSLFGDSIQYNDARQGLVGDCYFIATLAAIAGSDPDTIYQSITELGDGTYAIRFLRFPGELYYRIDADLPGTSYPVYARIMNNSLWAPLLEKAYCHFRYGQNSYASISGGWMNNVMSSLTYNEIRSTWVGSSVKDEVISFITTSLDEGRAITAATKYLSVPPIVSNHAYYILNLYTIEETTFVKLYNPWGSVVTIDIDRFIESFSTIIVCIF